MTTTFYYIKFILWVAIGGAVLYSLWQRQYEQVLGQKKSCWKPLPAILLLLPLIYWCAMRSVYMGDTGAYHDTFNAAPDTLAELPDYLAEQKKDKWFYGLSVILKALFHIGNPKIYFAIIATIQLLCVGLVYRKYSENYWLSIFLFVISTDYVIWMLNGARQFLAAAVAFSAAGFMLKKKYIWTALIIFLASRFHQSALILLPIMFIVQGKAWNKKTLLALVACILVVFFAAEFTTFLDESMSETQYAGAVGDWTSFQDDGTNPLRVLVYSVPAILSFVFRRRINEQGGRIINFCVNMSIMTAGIYIVSMVTSGIFIGRLPIYTSLYSYILLPWILVNCFSSKKRSYVWIFMIGAYTLFYLHDLL